MSISSGVRLFGLAHWIHSITGESRIKTIARLYLPRNLYGFAGVNSIVQ